MAHDERRGADVELRTWLGMVLLDLGDRERRAVELEGRYGRRYPTETDVEPEFQLHESGAGFLGLTGDILS